MASIPQSKWCIFLLFCIFTPYFRTCFRTYEKGPFPPKIIFFVTSLPSIAKCIYSTLFRKRCYISPLFSQIYTLPLRYVCSIYVLFASFWLFSFPYLDHSAFTHHAVHVLDAPASDLFSVPVMRLHHSVTDLSWPPSSALYDVKGVLSIVKYHLLSTTTLFVLVILFFNICWLLNHGWDTCWSETGASVINHRPQTDSAFIFTKWHFLI